MVCDNGDGENGRNDSDNSLPSDPDLRYLVEKDGNKKTKKQKPPKESDDKN